MKKTLILLTLTVLVSCASSKQDNGQPSENLKQLIAEKNFDIYSQWAEPQYTASVAQLNRMGLLGVDNAGGRINIRGNINFLKFRNDSVVARLPFYGERQQASSMSTIDQGINFNGVAENLKVEQKGSAYEIQFRIGDSNVRSETYDVRVRINSKLSSTIYVSSNQRFNIRYQGRVDTDTAKDNSL